ncbi:3-coathanger stack domain-containing protein [Emticicia sp. BO119]|uniref:3-coathanger stack domain-containing protein n=1 Tax=Emticicia sp. BO119 TaxID=2757768 RepID=UPI0015F030FB|nr:3-coathanger stack domain-containing protein [Emticicia sp. BO119]MBA4850283.1 hypothetical protein [Emticicia sp. BO119]
MKYPVLRSVILIGFSFLWSVSVFAQNTITRIEYYFDFDPGHGNGMAISFTPDTALTVNNVDLPVSNIQNGFHFLGVRAKDSQNTWSTTVIRPFLKEHILISSIPVGFVDRLEYFIDTDPGSGNGTAVPFTANTSNDIVFTVPLSAVSEGMHRISVRARDNDGQWSTVVVRPFIKATIPTAGSLSNMVQVEYFIDFDPGFGNAAAVSFQPGSQINNLNIMANLTGIPVGTHKLFVRAKNALGIWGTVGMREFTICNTPVNATITVTGNAEVCQGQNVSLSVASGYTYQWTFNGSDISGANSNTYAVNQTGEYSVKITNNGCISTATPVKITVNNNTSAPTVATSTPTICKGSAAVLQVSNCNGTVTWNTGSTANPLIISPGSTTSYTATCRPIGCTISPTSEPVQITVVDSPAALVINGAPGSAVCPNTSSTLTLTGCTGGILWSNGATTSSVTVSTLQTTIYTATCTLNTCTATINKTITVVSPSPASLVINTANKNICAGESVTLTASNCTGGAIVWSSGASGSSVSVNPGVTTTYTATCQIGSCTAPSVNAVQVFVRGITNTPIITTPSQTICKGTKVKLTAVYCYGTTIWSTGEKGNSIEVMPQVTTDYSATCQLNNCSSVNSNITTITVSDCPDPNTNVTYIEYFFDNDPGFGNGTAIGGFSANPAINNLNVSIHVGNLSEGFHWLTVRAKDGNDKWGSISIRPFLKIATAPATPSDIVKVEYFFDNDPGFGNATNYPITAGQQLNNLVISMPINTLSEGQHWLSVRVKDVDNKWTTVVVRPFVKEAVEIAGTLNNAEYFIDTDPGFGNGTNLPISGSSFTNSNGREAAITAGATSGTINSAINLTNVSNGEHRLFVRAKDTNNKWGTVGVANFYKQTNIAFVGAAAPTSSCTISQFSIPFTISGTYNAGNVFTAQLSDKFGDFSNPINLGTLTSTAAGTITAKVPYGTPYGTGYQIRIISSNPVITTNPSKTFSVTSICPLPCAGILSLASPADDYSSLSVIKSANAVSGSISASNKVSNNANVTYQAKSILLTTGFRADAGTVFKAEVGGCN